ncbi:polysaccharide deacetylase family protein [bacterium]|nr:polysaccharide deacetylase family protein [bacterium]
MPVTLLYHDVIRHQDDESGFAGAGAARYKLRVSEFHRHLAYIAEAVDCAPGVLEDVTQDQRTHWLLTFDDGGLSAATDIAETLEQRGWRGWFFITTDRLDTTGFISTAQLRDLHQRGHVIGSHSCSHPSRFSHATAEQQYEEWYRSRCVLEDLLGAEIRSASVPGGFYSTTVAQQAARAGLQVLFNSEPTTTESVVNGCQILGRYTVYRGMSAPQAAGLLSSSWPRYQQTLLWNAKKFAKRTGGMGYLKVRELLLRKAYATES